MTCELKDRVALVTGAGRGIGWHVATQLGVQGASLAVCARSGDQLETLVRRIRASGGRAMAVAGDIRNSEEVANVFAACDREYGRLDILVNNAGVGQFLSLADTTEEIWDATLDTNLKGAFLCCRNAVALMERSGGGIIVNVASIAAVRGFANFAAYSASKAGLVGMSRALREELREKGIRISVIMPGATDTPFWDAVSGTWDRARMIRAEEVAAAIVGIVRQPPGALTEELHLMPAGGAL